MRGSDKVLNRKRVQGNRADFAMKQLLVSQFSGTFCATSWSLGESETKKLGQRNKAALIGQT